MAILAVLLLMTAIILLIQAPQISDYHARVEARSYEEAFGFRLGDVAFGHGTADGLVDVSPDGPMARAGFRRGDVPFDTHGGGIRWLALAIREARAGKRSCVGVVNLVDYAAGLPRSREVCLEGVP